jgi:hypothetical protein
MSQEVFSANAVIPLGAGTVAAGTFLVPFLALPGTAQGGGITLTKVWYSTNKAIAAGSAPSAELLSLTTTGGTVAIVCTKLGSAAWTAGTPIVGTLVSGQGYVPGTAGYLGVKIGHENLAASETYITVGVNYMLGRGSV